MRPPLRRWAGVFVLCLVVGIIVGAYVPIPGSWLIGALITIYGAFVWPEAWLARRRRSQANHPSVYDYEAEDDHAQG